MTQKRCIAKVPIMPRRTVKVTVPVAIIGPKRGVLSRITIKAVTTHPIIDVTPLVARSCVTRGVYCRFDAARVYRFDTLLPILTVLATRLTGRVNNR